MQLFHHLNDNSIIDWTGKMYKVTLFFHRMGKELSYIWIFLLRTFSGWNVGLLLW
jgi:hypothetical protein